MRTITTIAASAALALALSGASQAAEITVGTDLGVSAGAGAAGVGAGATGSAAGAASVDVKGSLMAAASTTDAEIQALQSASAATKVHVVTVAETAEGLATFKTDHQADIMKIKAAIEANAALKSELEAMMVNVDQIVAADVEADGMIRLYKLG